MNHLGPTTRLTQHHRHHSLAVEDVVWFYELEYVPATGPVVGSAASRERV